MSRSGRTRTAPRWRRWLAALALIWLAHAPLAQPTAAQAADPWAELLAAHGTGDGVRYGALRRDRARLNSYLRQLSAVTAAQFDGWTRAQQMAHLINAYNAYVIATVVDAYPIQRRLSVKSALRPGNSVWQIAGFFDGIKHRAAGRLLTLDEIEHQWLRERYRDPRIHFALVCAARSCPALRAEPYAAERLDEQLEDQARRFLGDTRKNRFEPAAAVVQLSSIFDWFGEDFRAPTGSEASQRFPGNATQRAVLAFIRHYLPSEAAAWLEAGRYGIEYLEYDWALNDVETH